MLHTGVDDNSKTVTQLGNPPPHCSASCCPLICPTLHHRPSDFDYRASCKSRQMAVECRNKLILGGVGYEGYTQAYQWNRYG